MTSIHCPSCQDQVDGSADLCPACGWRFIADQPVVSIVRPAVRPKIQVGIALAATVDRTGSSAQFEVGIPLTYKVIVEQLAAKAREVTCWVASHGDLDEGQEFTIHTDSSTPEQAIEDIGKIRYGGGGDPPEHHLDAIEALLDRVPWTSDLSRARGAIVLFATADSKPMRSGISATELGSRIKEKGLLLYLVCQPQPTLDDLATGADGLVFEISNSPDPVALQKIAAQLAASIVATVASGATVPMTAPA